MWYCSVWRGHMWNCGVYVEFRIFCYAFFFLSNPAPASSSFLRTCLYLLMIVTSLTSSSGSSLVGLDFVFCSAIPVSLRLSATLADSWWSAARTECGKRYSQIERESLGQAWVMNIHRYYLLDKEFDEITDKQPLIPIYMGKKKGTTRVERHRLSVQGFTFT